MSTTGDTTLRDGLAGPPSTDPWRRYRPWWRVIGSVVAVVMLLGGLVRVIGVLAERAEPVDQVIDAAGSGALEVRLRDSDVEVVGADVDDITIAGTVTSGLRGSDFRAVRVDDRVLVTMRCGRWQAFHDCSADLRIEVPHDLSVTIDAPNSELTLRDLGGAVDARSTNSSMTVDGLAGPVRLRATNASIDAVGLRATDVDIETSNDDVRAEFVVAPRAVVVRSTNAAATVVVPDTDDFYDLQLSTSNAETRAEVRSDPESERRLQVTTSNDDIVVRYPD